MKWYQIVDDKPEIGTDVLVCFEPGNPCSCEVCSLEFDDEGNYIWWRIDRTYAVDARDYWAVIPMPEPKIPAYKEED